MMNTFQETTPPSQKLGRWATAKKIVFESWNILKEDKKLLFFPIFSLVTVLVFFIATEIIASTVLHISFFNIGNDWQKNNSAQGLFIFYCFLYYLIYFFTINFFATGLLVVVHGKLNGENISIQDGMKTAVQNLGKIFLWSLINSVIGVILSTIEDKFKAVGAIISLTLGTSWRILTYFSLPSLIIGQQSLMNSFKESAHIIRKMWGETAMITVGTGLFFLLPYLLVISAGSVGVFLLPEATIIILPITISILILTALIQSTLTTIFKMAIYEYAVTGKTPKGFSPELIQNAHR